MSIYPERSDIINAMRNPKVAFKADELVDGSIIIEPNNRVNMWSGGYSLVFPFYTKKQKKIAVRCWFLDIDDAKRRTQEISAYLNQLEKSCFCDFKYVEHALWINGITYPIVIMDWVEGKRLKDFINDNIIHSSSIITKIANEFRDLVSYFHQIKIAHGDLQHDNILIKEDGTLVIIDYDSMYIEPLNGMNDVIKGLSGYQHPARKINKLMNPKLDYFSELIIYLSLLIFADEPNIWPDYYERRDFLFSNEDFTNPSTSPLIKKYCSSPNKSISYLTNRLVEQLAFSNIDDLSPLEKILFEQFDETKNLIVSKWSKQPNSPQKMKIEIPDIKSITNKF